MLTLLALPAGAQPGTDLTPPVVQSHVDAVYPLSALARARHADVTLLVTVDADGHVAGVEVEASGARELDEAAVVAVRQWTFAPASRGGRPVPSRVRIPFHFAPPAAPPEIVPGSPSMSGSAVTAVPGQANATTGPSPITVGAPVGDGQQVIVRGVAASSRGASDFRIAERTLRAAPHQRAADLLQSAPGVYVAGQFEGEAAAPRVYLRGFDAEHGQDIAFTVSGIPLNQPSHIHGQGYADLNLIPPEVVRSLRVMEGVYDPRQGDFAVAGSIDFELGVSRRANVLKATTGSFGTRRLFALWAPEGRSEDTFAAATFRTTDGFGRNNVRGGVSGGVLGQYRYDLHDNTSLLVHLGAHGARSSLAGVVRRDDVEAGRIGFYDAYPDPTARSQSVGASRAQLGLTLEHSGLHGERTVASLWASAATFRGRFNFTGYSQRSQVNPEWVGRGDLLEQSNDDTSFGGRLSYRTRRYQPARWLSALAEFGTDARVNRITQAQNLLQAPQNETWDQRVNATVRGADTGLFLDAQLAVRRFVRLRGGLRADALFYDVDDELGNAIPAFQQKSHLVGFRRTATGIAWGPRVTLEADPLPWLRSSISYGEGFRSPQARQLEEGERAPYAKVKSYEAGVRLHHGDRLALTAVAYETRLSYDLAFDAAEGRLERIGPTTRRGLAGYLQTSPTSWFHAAVSATYVHATLDSPPPATADNPAPPYAPGQSLPYVPPIVLRSDVSAHAPLGSLLGRRVEGRLGYGTTFLSSRPLPYGYVSPPVFLLDALASIRTTPFELTLDAFNLLGARYTETEYAFVSSWPSRGAPSRLPARHLTAGAPRTVFLSLSVEFGS